MANEIVTTTSTAAGLVERVQGITLAKFLVSSRLFDVCNQKQANMAGSVQWAIPMAPSGLIASAQTEANAVTSNALTLAAATATIAEYPFQTLLSERLVNAGTYTEEEIAGHLAAAVVNGIDKAIAGQFPDFSVTVSGATMSYAVFNSAYTNLRNQGFVGQPVCVLGETQWASLLSDLTSKYVPMTNDEIASRGYVGTLRGVEVYTVPDYCLAAGDTVGKTGAMFFREVGVGFGYHDPLIKVKVTPYDTVNNYYGATSQFGVTEISPFGGVQIEAN